jgi:DNA (cytosine-5)-methyltransferase 1
MALQTNGQKVTKVIRGNGLNELALFAGAGGGILGGHLLGWRTVCAVEWESYPASVLLARQNDGILSPFPIWDDVQTFDGNAWRGIVDVVSGGFPCQDISAAGKGAGIDGERSGMWKEMARIIGEVRPQYAFVENSPMLTTRGLGTVLADLAKMGFDAEWGVLSAADVGANHLRERIWILAHSKSARTSKDFGGIRQGIKRTSRRQNTDTKVADTRCELREQGNTRNLVASKTERTTSSIHNQSGGQGFDENLEYSSSQRYKPQKEKIRTGWNSIKHTSWWEVEPDVGRVANGVAAGMDRLKSIGNGQVSEVARTAWNVLKGRLDERV